MTEIRLTRFTPLITLLSVALIAALTSMGTIESRVVLHSAILVGISVIAFHAGFQYRDIRDS